MTETNPNPETAMVFLKGLKLMAEVSSTPHPAQPKPATVELPAGQHYIHRCYSANSARAASATAKSWGLPYAGSITWPSNQPAPHGVN